MDKVKELLIKALEELAKEPHSNLKARAVKNQLATVVQRHFPHDRMRVARIVNPARFAPKKDKVSAEDIERRTYVYESPEEPLTPALTPAERKSPNPTRSLEAKAAEVSAPKVAPAPKKKAAAEDELKPSNDLEGMTAEELVESFGGLPAAKDWIRDNGGRIARNASADKVAAKIKKMMSDA